MTLSLVGLGIIALVNQVGSYVDPSAPNGKSLYGWATACVVAAALVLVIGIVTLAGWDSRRRFSSGDRREQISRLTKSLEEAMRAIHAIRVEIEEGQEVLDKLESELAARKRAVDLSQEDMDVVTNLIQREFRKERLPTLVRDLLLTVIGVLIGVLLQGGWPSWVPWAS